MVKGIFDFIFGIIILIILLPLALLIALVLYYYFNSLPIIIQERSITKEKPAFKLFKFRTINVNSTINEKAINDILFKNELSVHVNKFCRWLRITGFDEIPQLINIIKGEMSLVGPRPFIKADLEILSDKHPGLNEKRNQIKSKPGVTGLWQVYGDRQKGLDNLIEYDLQYEQKKCLLLDIKIILKTLPLICQAKHDDSIILKPLIYKQIKTAK